MKKITETKIEVQVTKKTITTCDICGGTDEHINDSPECDFTNTEIEFKDYEIDYPECQSGVNYTYDICHDCFKDKLMVVLSVLGAEPTAEDFSC